MIYFSKDASISKLNELGAKKEAFLFIISYDMQSNIILPLSEVKSTEVLYDFDGLSNYSNNSHDPKTAFIKDCKFVDYVDYKNSFDIVRDNLLYGNSYLCNLTSETEIELEGTLLDVFLSAKAKYKVYLPNRFVCFSPETFVKIENSKIYTYPMKGTIDADIENALDEILNDKKETAEHNTIVDLLRNDLGIVASNVKVSKYRYSDVLQTSNKRLIQISSEITGDLEAEYSKHIGDIIFSILPAGSVTGAPKKKTLEIIEKAEKHSRSFYTGIAGYFDGQKMDSCVLIRYIEQRSRGYFYKSGGGITIYSDPQKEYEELNNKIYVPIY
jgi:para-aminobenzoate synthetase component 1